MCGHVQTVVQERYFATVSPTQGVGSGKVTYQVASYNEAATRMGTVAIGTETFTITPEGRTALEFTKAESSTDGVVLAWSNLAWAVRSTSTVRRPARCPMPRLRR